MRNLTGEWTGYITGTNAGRVSISIFDKGDTLEGTIDVSDQRFGHGKFTFFGVWEDKQVSLKLAPDNAQRGVVITAGTVVAKLQSDGTLAGVWETELGTAGKFTVQRRTAPMNTSSLGEEGTRGPRRSSMTPLWVISLFVSLCEVVAGLAVTQAGGTVQLILTIFVVGFPILVASAFFAVLWRKPYVFYPPTEFGAATNVSEYVRAFAGFSTAPIAERQQPLIGAGAEPSRHLGPPPPDQDTPEEKARKALVTNVFKFFGFKGMRFSEVSDASAQAVFNLGKLQGFNLFDGLPGIAFFGHFADLEPAEIVTRVRFLLNNIDLAYHRVREKSEPALADGALRMLDQIQVEVLVPEEAPVEEMLVKIEEHRPKGLSTLVTLQKPSHIERAVQREYESLGLNRQ
ncbi:MAG: hypothetical protein GEU89_01260 [Kiloniellaceae bacterium]|nr:hypothetical protein [Kiloniellaceae bacterium]